MGENIIEVGKDYNQAPKNLCPYCKEDLHLILDAFQPEITKVVRSNCPHCGGEIFAAIMIITTKDHKGILGAIQAILNMFNPEMVTTVDKITVQ